MPANEKLRAFVAKCEDPAQLRTMIANAKARGEDELALAAFRRLVLVSPSEAPGTVEHDMWQTIFAFEHLLKEERGKTTLLARTRQKIGRDGSEHFEVGISYEEIAAAAEQAGDQRSVFFAKALLGAADSYRRGYVAAPDAAVTDMWLACWQVASRVSPKLRFQQPGQKPGRSTWFYFREAEGFARGAPAVVVYKAERGQADLQFSGTGTAQLAALVETLLDPDMRVVSAGKSASVRVAVPEISFSGSAEEQHAAICAGLEACERLRTLFVERISGRFDQSEATR